VEALAFKEAAGYAGSLFFCLMTFRSLRMRVLIMLAGAALTLSACGNNGQSGTTNVGDNLTAENIVANDVTAIDAVTADAANMAADVNYANELDNSLGNEANAEAPAKAVRPAAKTANPENAVVNSAANATD
jgi:hypothetical protein